MADHDHLARRFEESRPRLRSVAYRMLGSISEAEDAVQDAWLRLSRTDADEIESLDAWLTTVTARVCLNTLRARGVREDTYIPDPIVTASDDPEAEAVVADSVGLAMLVVLDRLSPAERLAFVLHDMFAISFDEIATIVGRSPDATRQLASRARRRVQGVPTPDADLARQREVVEAFFAAARSGDFDRLVAILDPDIVVRSDGGNAVGSLTVRGASVVARRAVTFADPTIALRPVVVNGVAGVELIADGRRTAVWAFTIVGGKVAAIDMLADPERV